MVGHDFYHVTLNENFGSIARTGIDPAFSRGKAKVCWYADKLDLVSWAIAHISARRVISPASMSVYVIANDALPFVRTKWRGVFTFKVRAWPVSKMSAHEALAAIEAMMIAQERVSRLVDARKSLLDSADDIPF